MSAASAMAHPNIAFIKYWGNRDERLRLPSNGSISMNLAGLETRTTVSFDAGLKTDGFVLGGRELAGPALERVSAVLDLVRARAGISTRAVVTSSNNFPVGAGIASSASAFAALALAASRAAGLQLGEADLSRLARRGSGSASRSIPGGFVEWHMGAGDTDSYAASIADATHWQLSDCIAIVSSAHKPIGSTEGHALAGTSPLQEARVADTTRRLDLCRRAILNRDFSGLASVVEQDSDLMHSVMMTGTPPLHYWLPPSLAVMQAVRAWRRDGLQACYTVDAGANVHVITPTDNSAHVSALLRSVSGVHDVLRAAVGGPAHLTD